MTGGRLRRVKDYIGEEPFCFTYGDGLADVDVSALIAFHKKQKRLATLTAVQPPGRYGALQLGADCDVQGFQEKPEGDGGWINGGFFVLEPEVIDLIEGGCNDLGAATSKADCEQRSTERLLSQWLLAADGYIA